MGDFEDEAATVPVEVDASTKEIALEDTAVAAISTIKVRARTCPGWLPAATNTAEIPRRHKKFYDAITASKLL